MNINTITAEDLRRMPDKEGLILQGCGGDLTEWVDGINEMLTKAGILKLLNGWEPRLWQMLVDLVSVSGNVRRTI